MRTVLITGAAGFIGSHLCEKLLALGDRVVGLDNFDPFYDRRIKERNLAPILVHQNFSFHEVSILDKPKIDEIFSIHDFTHIVHLAAKAGVRPSIQQPLAYQKTNIEGTVNLLEAAKTFDVKRFIFASSSSVYGNNKKVPFSETDPVDNPISPYAATKKAAELICYTYHHLYGIHIFGLRFFTVYGPRQRPEMAIHKFIRAIDQNRPIEVYGFGQPKRDFTYIDDILQGVVRSIERVEGYELINLGESQTISTQELISLIEERMGKEAIRQDLPMPPGDVNITYADISKARALLDYNPKTSIKEGIAKMVEWYMNEKKVLNRIID